LGGDDLRTKAVFFDLFETLVTEFADGARLTARTYNYMDLLGLSNDDFKREWNQRQEKRMTGYFPNYIAVIEDILESRQLKYDEAAIQYLYQARIKEKSVPFQNIRADVLELLTSLKSNHIKLGLISNCTEEEISGWDDSELSRFFDTTFFSYQAGLAKPDIRIYQMACDHLSVKPEEAIFIGDGGSNELEGADLTGLNVFHAIWFKAHIQSRFKKMDHPRGLMLELYW